MDNCPTCGKRILDWDPEGCELPSGQRACLAHLTDEQRHELETAYDDVRDFDRSPLGPSADPDLDLEALEDRAMGEALGAIDIEEEIERRERGRGRDPIYDAWETGELPEMIIIDGRDGLAQL